MFGLLKRGLNKRAQEGMTLTTLLLIIVGVVVAVVLILGATGILGDIFDTSEALPGNLEAVAQSCKISAEASLITSFCYEFKEIDNDRYVNCEDARIRDSLVQQNVDFEGITCAEDLKENAKRDVCENVADNKKEDTFFNGVRSDNCSAFVESDEGQEESEETEGSP